MDIPSLLQRDDTNGVVFTPNPAGHPGMHTGIVAFYDPAVGAPFRASEPNSTTLEAVLAYDDEMLERRHDYIQFLFPLPEPSPVVPDAPIVTEEVVVAFLQRPELRQNLRRAWLRMCRFYGFHLAEFDNGAFQLRRNSNFYERAKDSWWKEVDHNHLRITRIIRCLRFLDLVTEAQHFCATLLAADEGTNIIMARSKYFWCAAAERPLAEPPSFPQDPLVEWLWEDEGDEEGHGTWVPGQEPLEGTDAHRIHQKFMEVSRTLNWIGTHCPSRG